MQTVIQGFISQSLKMDPLEKARRWKRSLDGYISFRKAVLIALVVFAFILYLGPSFFGWIFGTRSRAYTTAPSCINDKLIQHTSDLLHFNAHVRHKPQRPEDSPYLSYVGNGHFGLQISDWDWDDGSEGEGAIFIAATGQSRTLSVPVGYKPLVRVLSALKDFSVDKQAATVVNYAKGMAHRVSCVTGTDGRDVSVSQQIYAHRAVPEVLVQEIKITNPTANDESFRVHRTGMDNWNSARSYIKTIDHGDGGQQYVVVSGTVPVPQQSEMASQHNNNLVIMAAIVSAKLDETVIVDARMTHTMSILSAVSYSKPISLAEAKDLQGDVEKQAVSAIMQAAGMSSHTLKSHHVEVWEKLWTTGFTISHSMAEDVVNGHQVNATMYYVLSQVPTPLHSIPVVESARRAELLSHLAYLEGCYGGLPTLHATNLWKSLHTVDEVNTIVKLWILTLEKNGCHKLIKAGGDGVIQAMVLSLAGLAFRQQHLELNSHPKDLHRDFVMRRVSYGNATHLNISVVVGSDNRAVLRVALDRRDKDYFACDAGCLDPPVQLSTEQRQFPVKLTDPVTAVLYITSDYQHMQELKHTIHVKEVVDAPAHEHHVIALHRNGNKLGGLPAIFWFSIGFLIFVFHVFLFKLIWQEYCAGQDRFRTRKFSDYQ